MVVGHGPQGPADARVVEEHGKHGDQRAGGHRGDQLELIQKHAPELEV